MDVAFLSKHFINAFKEKPWNEYVICPKCKSPDDFGPNYAWGESESPATCPHCDSALALYWSIERVKTYLQRSSSCLTIVVDDDLAAWAFGYEMRDAVFYVDTVTILPQYRKRPGTRVFLKEFNLFLDTISPQYASILSRTHKHAKAARRILILLGFEETKASEEDPERSYWVRESRL